MLAGVGNKASDYNDEDVNTVQLFANLIWRVVRYQRSRKTIERERLRLQTILKTSSDGIHILDSEGTLVEANDAFLKMLGLDQSAIGRLHISVWNTQDSWETLKARFDALINHQGTLVLETRHRRRDGVALDVEVSTRAIKIEGKDYIYAASRDISDRKHTEEQLRVAATAMESQEGTVISDAAGIILRVNQAFAEITGYSVDEAVGKSTSLLRSGRHDNAFYAALWHSINSTGTWKGEIWNRRKNGEIYPEWLTITAVKAADGTVTHYVGTFSDITKRKEAEDQINELAFYDPLTHLPNRRLLVDRLSQALAASIRNEREGALLFVDLDNFKKVNDTHGHDQGDLLLREVARRLTTSFRGVDTVARIGGDEFVVVLADLSGDPEEAAAQAESVGQKILAILGQPYQITGNVFRSTPSIGITLFGEQRGNIDELMKQADIAMYQAKAAGRNALRFFDPELQETMKARASLEADLHHGIQEGEILLHYQPQVDGVGRLMGAEALVRWRHPERGLVSPAEFIPLAEETGLILAIGDYVLETGCRQLVAWANRAETAHITLSVNVSARQFRQPNFVDQVLGVVNRTGVNPRRLKLELTESMLVEDIPEIIAKMMALKSRGISFSLDDFGTGYSSLAYLKRLPLDQLKIDQSFVRDVLSDPNDAAIAKTIVSLAQSLGLDCIAEGVETAEQREFLADSGCHAYQGYFFSRPLPLEAFDAYAMQT
ncbi:MAG TPA: EAL domain-containing protein [Rhodospirillaceae bacterium]|nr:EAL domain-containing protein [Rhodospirillaceae bacterium]